MAKLTLNDITVLSGAMTKINQNSDRIEQAVENTLSRDGTAPNMMGAPLDMNGYKILNLPEPVGYSDPVRLQDLNAAIAAGGGTGTGTGTGGSFNGGTVSGDTVFTGTVTYKGLMQQVDPTTGFPVFTLYGTSSPEFALIGQDDGATFSCITYSNNAVDASYWMYRARGTGTTPASVVSGDYIGSFGSSAWNNGNFKEVGSIGFTAYTVNASYVLGKISFLIGNGSDASFPERGYLLGDGSFVWGAPIGGAKGTGSFNTEKIYTNGVPLNGALTVATLPAASTVAYARTFVTDANSTTFMSTVAGGGSNKVPVFSDGTNWKIG